MSFLRRQLDKASAWLDGYDSPSEREKESSGRGNPFLPSSASEDQSSNKKEEGKKKKEKKKGASFLSWAGGGGKSSPNGSDSGNWSEEERETLHARGEAPSDIATTSAAAAGAAVSGARATESANSNMETPTDRDRRKALLQEEIPRRTIATNDHGKNMTQIKRNDRVINECLDTVQGNVDMLGQLAEAMNDEMAVQTGMMDQLSGETEIAADALQVLNSRLGTTKFKGRNRMERSIDKRRANLVDSNGKDCGLGGSGAMAAVLGAATGGRRKERDRRRRERQQRRRIAKQRRQGGGDAEIADSDGDESFGSEGAWDEGSGKSRRGSRNLADNPAVTKANEVISAAAQSWALVSGGMTWGEMDAAVAAELSSLRSLLETMPDGRRGRGKGKNGTTAANQASLSATIMGTLTGTSSDPDKARTAVERHSISAEAFLHDMKRHVHECRVNVSVLKASVAASVAMAPSSGGSGAEGVRDGGGAPSLSKGARTRFFNSMTATLRRRRMELKDCKKDWRRRLAALERAKIAERTGRGGGGGAKASDVNAQDVLDVQDDSLAIARRMANTTQATVDSGMATLAALGDQTEQLNAIGDRVGELRGETQRGQDLERRYRSFWQFGSVPTHKNPLRQAQLSAKSGITPGGGGGNGRGGGMSNPFDPLHSLKEEFGE